MVHAVAGAVLAQLSGNSATGGAVRAASGELIARGIAATLYPGRDPGLLTQDEKDFVSALSQMAGGLAAGMATDSTAGGTAGQIAGKNAVENNWLSVQEEERKTVLERKEKAGAISADERQELAGIRQTHKARDEAIKSVCTDGNKGGSGCGALIGPAQEALKKYGENVSYSLIYKDLYPQGAKNLEGILKGVDAGDISRDQAITAIAQSTHRSWNEVAKDYDAAMQTQAIAVALAGAKGFGGEALPGKTSKPSSPKPEVGQPKPNAGNAQNVNPIRNSLETQASIDKKLNSYLLAKDHPVGGSKAEWFDSALGFNKTNSTELAKQIVFDPTKAVKTSETQFGSKFDQVIPITGANGRVINVKFGWIKNNDGIVRLVTAIPAKK